VGATIAPLFYNPDPYDTLATIDTGIGITFNSQVKAGTGNVTLSIANAGVAGTVVENFGVGSSVSISENRVTINPTADLSGGEAQYFISYPSGAFTNNEGTDYVGTGYTFGTRAYQYQLWSWGYNAWGGLGLTDRASRSSPVQVPGTTWDNGSGTLFATAAVKTDGTLWTWGGNETGELGLNNTTKYSSPVQVGSDTTWSTAIMDDGGMATKTDGTLWIWGLNNYGQLGQNNKTNYSSPVQIPGTTWSANFAAKTKNKFAIKTDGTLWAWGHNSAGGLGLNQGSYPVTSISSPTQIPGTTWANIDAGDEGTIAIKTDGTLWVWGANGTGQLGQNEGPSFKKSSPVQIPGTTWSVGASRGGYMLAIKTDGTMWGWGKNHRGQLGLNSVTAPTNVGYSSPVQVPGTTWSHIEVSVKDESYALKTDGTLWTWGYNNRGQLGHNDVAMRSSPTQIPGTTWSFIKTGGTSVPSGVFALKRV
jgi:alpha-tubulin suppressor-like RCC1 family protein